MNNLYEMKLHEKINYDSFEVYWVPGGWVYRFFEKNPSVDSVFVPLNDEMKDSLSLVKSDKDFEEDFSVSGYVERKQTSFPVYTG